MEWWWRPLEAYTTVRWCTIGSQKRLSATAFGDQKVADDLTPSPPPATLPELVAKAARGRRLVPRAYGYRRVSTKEQAKSGLGLGDQKKAIKRTARVMKVPLWRIRTDGGKSGELPAVERPGLLMILQYIKRGDVLIVAKRDRLARDDVEIKTLERGLAKAGVRLVSAAGEGTEGALDDPSSALQRDITDLFSAHELRMIRKRTKDALREKRVRGERAGGVPFGFNADADGALTENPTEREALDLMIQMRESGSSYGEIVAELVKKNVPPKKGGTQWQRSSVWRILKTHRKHAKRTKRKEPPTSADGE